MIKDKTNQTKKTPTNINKNSNNSCENFLDVEINTNKLCENNEIDPNSSTSTNKEKNKKSKINCRLHVMPPQISDEDINALFSGLVSIVRRKIELESRAEIININLNYDKLARALKAKQAECVRLKNEILNLKSQLENNK
ncbi:MAG TPA: hypothetical protein IAB72_02270 [Candidatus Onthoplasma faecipullorum]|nr:hypothetical protein [Candidatus Onthoplasma faecipullorum]